MAKLTLARVYEIAQSAADTVTELESEIRRLKDSVTWLQSEVRDLQYQIASN
jgi:FtsZ-binding cell division protein ZapB